MKNHKQIFIAAILVGVTVVCPLPSSFGGTRTVVLDSDPVPGVGAGVNFSFGNRGPHSIMNNSGQVAFHSRLVGSAVEEGMNDHGIWSEGNGNGLELIALTGSPAPGTADGVNFWYLGDTPPAFNDLGQTAFHAELTNENGVDAGGSSGIWSEGNGNGLELVAQSGNVAPGTNGAMFGSFSLIGGLLDPLTINNSGQTMFRGGLDTSASGVDSQNDFGLWVADATGSLQLVAREGDQAPGMTSGVTFSSLRTINSSPFFGNWKLNDSGQVAFAAATSDGNVESIGIWSDRSGSGLEQIIAEGDEAPGTGGGLFLSLYDYDLNDSGQLTLAARTGRTDGLGVWSEARGNGLELIVHEDDELPGRDGNVMIDYISGYKMNESGYISFTGEIGSSSTEGFWAGDSTGLRLLALEGEHAPGTPAGVVFDKFFSFFSDVNDTGRVAFAAQLAGPGLTSTYPESFGIWFEDEQGVLQLHAFGSDLLGGVIEFNDLGQMLIDGVDGIYVSEGIAVPEPGTIIYVGAGLAALGFSRNRRRPT